MDHLSNDHEDLPSEHKNSHKLRNETGHPVVNLTESQWKLRQEHHSRTDASIRRKKINLKEQD